MKPTERSIALELLFKVLTHNTHLTHLLQAQSYTPFTKELCFGTCRYYHQLECIAQALLPKRPKQLTIWIALILGLYQLRILKLPDFAVINETVKLLCKPNDKWGKGLLNAVLRRYATQAAEIESHLVTRPEFMLSHPAWFIERIKKSWPSLAASILEANNQQGPMSLRVNQQCISRKNYLQLLQECGQMAYEHRFSSEGIRLEKPIAIQELPGFSEGWVSVQDEAAQLAVSLLDLKPNLRILDACAAPGGKTCHILEAEPGIKECVALDIEPLRIKKIQQNLNRLHLNATLLCHDASKPEIWWDRIPFDRILLDAPCSATGVIRRHPDIKLLRTPEQIRIIQQIQYALLESLWPLLKPGGILVYATCSVLPEENTLQIQSFLERHDDCRLKIGAQPWGELTPFGWQIIPGTHHMDGFFYSCLHKVF